MPEWYQVGLPAHLTWHGNAPFWRSALIAESRKTDQSAFTGRNLLRVFQPLHTQYGVALDLILVLVDVPRERVLLAAFPSFLGSTTGAGIPMPTAKQFDAMRSGESVSAGEVRVIGGDENLRNVAAAAEQRIAAENDVRQESIVGPDGSKWSVYLQESSARPTEFLEADGHTLTESATHRVECFIRGVVIAAREWVPANDESRRGQVEVKVERASPVAGPSLQESLAPSSQGQANPSNGFPTHDRTDPTAPPTSARNLDRSGAYASSGSVQPRVSIDLAVFLHLLGRPESQRRITGVLLTDAEAEQVRGDRREAQLHHSAWQFGMEPPIVVLQTASTGAWAKGDRRG